VQNIARPTKISRLVVPNASKEIVVGITHTIATRGRVRSRLGTRATRAFRCQSLRDHLISVWYMFRFFQTEGREKTETSAHL
jgi:hypothetical protein